MFRKILIANRGEIAVRIIRTCRDMGIATVTLYEDADRRSLHVRLADQAVPLPTRFSDGAALIALAQEMGADAIHPGYGFLAEDVEFMRACADAGLAFIGPSPAAAEAALGKLEAIRRVRAHGFPTIQTSEECQPGDDLAALQQAAEALGYPVVVKICRAGRGPGERLVRDVAHLEGAIMSALAESQAVFGQRGIFLEKAILPVHQVSVQIVGDRHGHLVHLGDREGSLQFGSRKIIEEAPAPCLDEQQRAELCAAAVEIARLLGYQGVGTVEFMVDDQGRAYFSEMKARIQTEHALPEMLTRIDLVREQIRLAAGEPLRRTQADVPLHGHAIACRINAEDPLNRLMPSPGHVRELRLPAGPNVRVDTYLDAGSDVPAAYNPLIAKLTVWGEDRQQAIARLERALRECLIVGVSTNIPFIQRVFGTPEFLDGAYDSETLHHRLGERSYDDTYYRDLAVIAALRFARRYLSFTPVTPERTQSGWHRSSRRLPE